MLPAAVTSVGGIVTSPLIMLLTVILLMGLLRREKRGIANTGFESFLIIVLYVACFALIALAG